MKETFASVCLVKDIRPAVFSALLTYIYTDTLQLQRPEDITELLVVANQVHYLIRVTDDVSGSAQAMFVTVAVDATTEILRRRGVYLPGELQ